MDSEKEYHRKALKLSGAQLFAMAFATLGVIYSDIGTSPLYVLNGIWASDEDAPSEEDIIGGISAVIWAITLLPLLKYVVFALEFGTGEGEGGPFALFMSMFPRHAGDERSLTTYTTGDSATGRDKGRLGKLARFRWPLMVWTVFGTALTLSDGILTPAVSVVSAVGGIAVAQPSVSNAVVGVSIAFLVFLFGIQPLGTQRIALLFAPITAIWLLLLGGTGIYNITTYPAIWRAYDPSRAILWFVRTGRYDNLAGVLLAITGCEAMFANLGQFNKASIRLGFGGFAYPMLILAYLGQGAMLIAEPSSIQNVFYLTIPGPTGGGLYWIVFIFAVLATLIASQAMITATFSLVNQLVGMQAFPAIRIKHTSSVTAGQVYIGGINWLLMIGTIGVVAGFGSSSALTLAYGFAVATVLFVTTTLISLSIPFVKNLPYILGLAFLLFFGFLDGLFWGASLIKVPLGAWFPLSLGCLLTLLMVFWAWGRELEQSFEDRSAQKLSRIISVNGQDEKMPLRAPLKLAMGSADSVGDHGQEVGSAGHLSDKDETDGEAHDEVDARTPLWLRWDHGEWMALQRIPAVVFFHKKDGAGRGVPHSFVSFLHRYPALPEVVIFLSTHVVGVPHVPEQDRYVVNKVRSFEGFYGVTMRVGYLDRSPPSLAQLLPLFAEFESRNPDASLRIDRLKQASAVTTHIVTSYTVLSATDPSLETTSGIWKWPRLATAWVRRILVEELYGRGRVMFPDRANVPDAIEGNTFNVIVAAAI